MTRTSQEIKADVDRIRSERGEVSGMPLDRLRSVCGQLAPLIRECSEHGHKWGVWHRSDVTFPNTMVKQCEICGLCINVAGEFFGKPFDVL